MRHAHDLSAKDGPALHGALRPTQAFVRRLAGDGQASLQETPRAGNVGKRALEAAVLVVQF